MKEYWFYYHEEGDPNRNNIRIKAKRQPGKNTIPRSGTWILQEAVGVTAHEGFFTRYSHLWKTPCFPEITWGRLRKMKFVTKVAV